MTLFSNQPTDAIARPRPAATVVVVRPQTPPPQQKASTGDAQEIEIYLVKRHHKSGFMAGAHVFPGGRVEEQDHAHATALAQTRRRAVAQLIDGVDDDVDAAAFAIAAIRETAEECGLLLAHSTAEPESTATRDDADAIVSALRQDPPRPFHSLLDDANLEVALEGLAPLAWWLTPEAEPKRYDTRFFAAWAPAGQHAAPDLVETTAGDWFTPTAALAAYASGNINLAPPTMVTLEDLRGVVDLGGIQKTVVRPLEKVCPRVCTTDTGLVLALPGDPLFASDDNDDTSKRTSPIRGWSRTRIIQNASGRFASATAIDANGGG